MIFVNQNSSRRNDRDNPNNHLNEVNNQQHHPQIHNSEIFNEKRLQLFNQLPNNICSYTCSFDLIQGSNFLTKLKVKLSDSPKLLPVLKRRPPQIARYSQAITAIQTQFQSNYNIRLVSIEDPWIIIICLRHFLNRFITGLPILPVCSATCPNTHTITFTGDLEYVKQAYGPKVRLKNKQCAQCGLDMVVRPDFLPEEFFVRVRGSLKAGYFDDTILPYFNDYRASSYIQYDDTKKHFRTIKKIGNRLVLLDGVNTTWFNHDQEEKLLEEEFWTTYIVGYRRRPNKPALTLNVVIGENVPCGDRVYVGGMFNSNKNKQGNSIVKTPNQRKQDQHQAATVSNQEHNLFSPNQRSTNQQLRPAKEDKIQVIINDKIRQFKQGMRKRHKETIFEMERKTNGSFSTLMYDFQNFITETFEPIIQDNKQLSQKIIHLDAKVDRLEMVLLQVIEDNQLYKSRTQSRLIDQSQEGPKQQYLQPNKKIQFYDNTLATINSNQDSKQLWLNVQQSQAKDKFSNKNLRASKLDGLPLNSCSYVAALDFLTENSWLKLVKTKPNVSKSLIECLSGSANSKFNDSILNIRQWDSGQMKYHNKLNTQEDPWIIIKTIQQMVTGNNIFDQNGQPFLPIMKCNCDSNNQTFAANLQLIRVPHHGRFQNRKMRCQKCKSTGTLQTLFLPSEFFVRMEYNQEKLGIFQRFKQPYYKDYYISAIIQYSKERKHFRTLRLYGRERTDVIDNDVVQRFYNSEERQTLLQGDGQWTNYILSFRASDRIRQKIIFNTRINHAQIKSVRYFQTPRIYVGGSSKVRFLHWNIRTGRENQYQPIKMNLLKRSGAKVISLNETRIPFSMKDCASFESVPSTQANDVPKINAQILVSLDIEAKLIQKGQNWVVVMLKFPEQSTIFASIYCAGRRNIAKTLQSINQLREAIEIQLMNNNDSEIVIAGDFNLTKQQMQDLRDQQPDIDYLLSCYRMNFGPTSTGNNLAINLRQIDHIFYTGQYVSHQKLSEPGQCKSDHSCMFIDLAIMFNKQNFTRPNPDLKQYINMRVQLSEDIKDKCLLNIIHEGLTISNINRAQIISKKDQQLLDAQDRRIQQIKEMGWSQRYRINLDKKIQNIIENRYSKESKLSFAQLKSISRINRIQKKEGGLMAKAYYQGKLIQGSELQFQLLNHYQQLHRDQFNILPRTNFPNINFTDKQILRAMNNVNQGKAGSFDGVNCGIFKISNGCCRREIDKLCKQCRKKFEIAKQLSTEEYWRDVRSMIHFQSRLVALNKEHPRIPELERYRPIIVMSHVIKFIEGLIVDKLKNYLCEKSNIRQFGAKRNVSIQELKADIFTKMIHLKNKYKGKKQPDARHIPRILFVDIKNAFDSVIWHKLFGILRQKRILNENQIQILQFIYSNTFISNGKGKNISIGKGTPQGMSTSPILFQIYINSLIDSLNNRGYDAYLFADDLAVITQNEDDMQKVIDILQTHCFDLKLTINRDKSGIMIISNSSKTISKFNDGQLRGFKYVRSYRYLGTIINSKIDTKSHTLALRPKLDKICHCLTIFRRRGNMHFNSNLFQIYIQPQFRLLAQIFELVTGKQKKQIILMYKKYWKKMTCLPKSTPNTLLKCFIGDPREQIVNIYKVNIHKLRHYQINTPLDFGYIEALKFRQRWKKIPLRLTKLIQVMYSTTCNCHKRIKSQTNLEDHNIAIDIFRICDLYQDKSTKDLARTEVKYALKRIASI